MFREVRYLLQYSRLREVIVKHTLLKLLWEVGKRLCACYTIVNSLQDKWMRPIRNRMVTSSKSHQLLLLPLGTELEIVDKKGDPHPFFAIYFVYFTLPILPFSPVNCCSCGAWHRRGEYNLRVKHESSPNLSTPVWFNWRISKYSCWGGIIILSDARFVIMLTLHSKCNLLSPSSVFLEYRSVAFFFIFRFSTYRYY